MANKQQTAVEWLEQELLKPNIVISTIIDKAKAMEKEQCLKMLPYDLNELAEKACPDVISSAHSAYKAGFQKAIELLTFKSE
jgi:hypothetical protein